MIRRKSGGKPPHSKAAAWLPQSKERGAQGWLRTRSAVAVGAGVGGDDAHLADVVVEGLAADFGEAADGERVFAFEGFVDDDVVGFFEFCEVAGEVSLGEAALALEIEKVGLGDGVEDGHNHQARGLVNHAIEIGESLEFGGHCFALGIGLVKRYRIS